MTATTIERANQDQQPRMVASLQVSTKEEEQQVHRPPALLELDDSSLSSSSSSSPSPRRSILESEASSQTSSDCDCDDASISSVESDACPDNSDGSARSVTFDQRVRVRRFSAARDFATQQRVWYNAMDYYQMKQECRIAIRLHKEDMLQDDDEEFCFRGLEGRTKQGSKDRKEFRKTYRVAVILEHMRQRYQGENDEEALAAVAFDRSLQNQYEAYVQGVQDAESIGIMDEDVVGGTSG